VRTTDNWRNYVVSTFLPSAKSVWIELGVSTQYTLFDDITLLGVRKLPSGLIDNQLAGGIKIFPNPCDQIIHLKSDYNADFIRLISMDGKVVLNQPITNSLDISTIANGYYLLNLYSKYGISASTGIIVNHTQSIK
jgi:hypothetical protein